MRARRLEYCYECSESTTHQLLGLQGGKDDRRGELWRCETCNRVMLTLADVTDAQSMVLSEAARAAKRWGLSHELKEDIALDLQAVIWEAFLDWNPGLCRFRAYATTRLTRGSINWDRERRGRVEQGHSPKPLSISESLDAPAGDGRSTLGASRAETLTGGVGDPSENRRADGFLRLRLSRDSAADGNDSGDRVEADATAAA